MLKENGITKDKDICELIEIANHGLTDIRNRFEELLNQVATLENEKAALNTDILGLRNSIYTNNEIIRKQDIRSQTLGRKQRVLEVMLKVTNKDTNYNKVIEIVDQRLKDKRLLLVTALVAILQTLKTNPYGLNLLSSSPLDIEDYIANNIDGKNLLQFAESCYNILLKSYAKTIV
jgi:hypothetical protein